MRQDALSNNLKKPIGYVIERATIKKGVGDLLDVFVRTKPLPTVVASFPGLPALPPVQAIKNWRQEGRETRLVACYL